MKRKINPSHEVSARKTLEKLAKTNSVEGQYGIVDFTLKEFITVSEGGFRFLSEVSTLMNALNDNGKVKKIRRGSPTYPSRWDVRDFIKMPAIQMTVENKTTPKPIDTTPVVEDNQVDNVDIARSITEMVEFMKGSQHEMVGHLNGMIAKIRLADPGTVASIQEELIQTSSERDKLQALLANARKELAKHNRILVKKEVLVRSRNSILDDVERYFTLPAYQKSNREDILRQSITDTLNKMVEEVTVGES